MKVAVGLRRVAAGKRTSGRRAAQIAQDILDAIDELVLAEGRELRLSLRAKEEFRRELFCSVRKLDVIQELVDDPSVTEIMVNGYRNIFVEKSGKIRKWRRLFHRKNASGM